jgi:2-oxoglutarate ferredoxin oxidoreductase subunit gamma
VNDRRLSSLAHGARLPGEAELLRSNSGGSVATSALVCYVRSVQREIMLTGVGGQGIQLTAKTLATAAVAEGRHVMLLGHYAGAMRGGQTDASVVLGDEPLRTLPIVQEAWAGIVMDGAHWQSTNERIRPGGVVVVNSSLVGDVGRPDCTVVEVPATQMATDLGAPMGAGYVLVSAFAAVTSLVSVDAMVAAMRELVPPYRTQHLEANEQAIRAGFERAPIAELTAWERPVAAGGGQ